MTREVMEDNSEWLPWMNEAWQKEASEGAMWRAEGLLVCGTIEGVHVITEGDYLIQGVKGEIYPCKPDIFEMTYEKVDD